MRILFFAILKLFFIIFLGFCFYRKRILREEALKFLTFFVINITVPFLIFSKIIENFVPSASPHIFTFIGLSLFIFLTGLISGMIVAFSINRRLRREFVSLTAFQNSGYLPMNIAFFLLPAASKDIFLVYIFLYILGFNVLLWSVGSFFIFKKKDERFKITSIFTAPIVSTLFALLFVYLGWREYVPDIILSPLKIIGNISFPLSMIILGAWLAKSKTADFFVDVPTIVKIVLVKLILVPAIFFFIVFKLELPSLFGLFIVLEASMPSAASLPIVVNLRRADSEFVSQGVLVCHSRWNFDVDRNFFHHLLFPIAMSAGLISQLSSAFTFSAIDIFLVSVRHGSAQCHGR